MPSLFRPVSYGSGDYRAAARLLPGKRGAALRAEARRLEDLHRQDLLADPAMADRVQRRRAARALREPKTFAPLEEPLLVELARRLEASDSAIVERPGAVGLPELRPRRRWVTEWVGIALMVISVAALAVVLLR